MPPPYSPPTTHRLGPGQELSLPLAEGSELFCRHGPLRLAIHPLDAAGAPQALVLYPGQGWRAPQDLWLRLTPAGPDTAALELHAAAPASRPPRAAPGPWRQCMAGLRKLRQVLGAAQAPGAP